MNVDKISGLNRRRGIPLGLLALVGASLAWTTLARATQVRSNPAGKFYVADVDGNAEIQVGNRVEDIYKKATYNAEGTVVETKPNSTDAMVFSNGTGIYIDQDTRMEVKRFEQEPFVPDRTDYDVEPSISHTRAHIPHGTVGICTSKLVAGSSMTYWTPLGGVNIRGGKVVIQSEKGATVVSMLQGDCTVFGGDSDMGGHALIDGEQAIIKPGPAGQPPWIQIQPIPNDQVSALEAMCTMAFTAKKTVYFESRPGGQRSTNVANTAVAPVSAASSSPSTSPSGGAPITAFDGDTLNPSTSTPAAPLPPEVIVAVPVVPTNLPVQYTVSPASI